MLSSLESLNHFLWSGPVLILLGAVHLLFTLRLKFPQKLTFQAIRLSITSDDSAPKDEKNLSGFAALATTLAATLGTGNIVGVSTAIALGGPGALFWCWITGILGMSTAYAECYLSCLFRRKRADGTAIGGPMYVLEDGLHRKGLALLYALCLLFAALGVGCTTQSSAISDAIGACWNISPHITGILAAVFTGFVIIGGIKSIGNFCVRIVPVLGFFYIGCCLLLLWMTRNSLPAALTLIFQRAFHPGAALGGFVGSTLQTALRFGVARGLFTNEAGIGTASITAAASASSPRRQGLISMTAVFWDTVVMCALTGIVIVANMIQNPASIAGYSSGGLMMAAFSMLPFYGEELLSVALVAFALATLVGWCYFGEKGCEYLFGEKGIPIYHFCYIIMAYLGAVLPMGLVWGVTDLVNGIMVFPNVFALFLLRKRITIRASGKQTRAK